MLHGFVRCLHLTGEAARKGWLGYVNQALVVTSHPSVIDDQPAIYVEHCDVDAQDLKKVDGFHGGLL